MAAMDDDGLTTRARYPLIHLRRILQEAREADEAERIHVALINTVDGLVSHVERQARAIDELRSDLLHKQGIVSNIGGGAFRGPAPTEKLSEFASSSNGDRWFIGRDEASGTAHVVHQANQPSGGAVSRIEIGAFLNRGSSTPEAAALLKMIGDLVM